MRLLLLLTLFSCHNQQIVNIPDYECSVEEHANLDGFEMPPICHD